jgi:hypothetical protein
MDYSMRSIFEQFEDEYEHRLDALRHSFNADAAIQSNAPPVCDSIDSTTQFLSVFDPALTGMRMLVTERIDQLLFKRCLKPFKVSVDLSFCRRRLLQFAGANLGLFPAVMESVFNSIGGLDGPPLVVDTGASCCITPCRSDFVEYTTKSSVKIKDLYGLNKVAGEGLVRWFVLDRFGREHALEMRAYHIPHASVRLLSPQSFFQQWVAMGIKTRLSTCSSCLGA